jgi:hypothetical protein
LVGDIQFGGAITRDGTARELMLQAGTGNITFGSTVGSAAQPLNRLVLRESSQVSFDGAVQSLDGVFVLPGSVNAMWTSSSSINFPNTDIYFDHDGKTITLNSNLSARNIYFYRGVLDLAGKEITTDKDFVVFGNAYNPDDPEWTGTDTRFAYYHEEPLAYYPAGGTYDAGTGAFGTLPNASFSDLSGSTISVGANFYNNRADMKAETAKWNLNLNADTGKNPVFNNTATVIAGQWGTPYAVAFNMSVENSTANSWVTASTVAQNINDDGGNDYWQFDRPIIEAAATVSDNVIRVEFSMPVIFSMPLEESYKDKDLLELLLYNYGAEDCYFSSVESVEVNVDDDNKIYYYFTTANDGTWNTDATGASPVDDDSTDRSGDHQTTIPNLTLLPGLFRAADGVTMIQAYGTHGKNMFIETTDEARPVLIAVEIGQEAHESDPDKQAPYDAHNYIQLRYSERVDIKGFDSAGEMKEYIKINDKNGPLGEDGKIINVGSGLEITGLISITGGSLSTGSRNIDNTGINMNDGTVHALYRNFSLNPFDKSEPDERKPIAQPHHLRISIAGWTDSTTTALGDEISHRFYPGFIISATEPSGTITVSPKLKITDTVGNILDTLDHKNNLSISGSGWDTTPPSIAKYVEDEDGWADEQTEESNYEIIGMDTGGGRVGHFELHLFDNEPGYKAEGEDKWFFSQGWQDIESNEFPDTRGGFGNKSEQGGIRMSSLVNSLQAFSYEERGSHFGPGMKGFKFDNASINQKYTTPFFGDPKDAKERDVPYLRLYLEDDDTTLFPMITNFSLQYKMYDQDSSPNGGFITDLAGNLLQDFEGLTVDRTPPSISMSLAPIGGDQLYILFSKKIDLEFF